MIQINRYSDTMTPEYLHVVLVHLPLVGVGCMILLLAAYWVAGRSRAWALAGLLVGAVTALPTPIIMGTGEEAWERLKPGGEMAWVLASDGGAALALNRHEEVAHQRGKLFYLVLVVSLAGLAVAWRLPKYLPWAVGAALLIGVVAVVANVESAKTGGEIRRPDFRAS